jgi:hypothetical protein
MVAEFVAAVPANQEDPAVITPSFFVVCKRTNLLALNVFVRGETFVRATDTTTDTVAADSNAEAMAGVYTLSVNEVPEATATVVFPLVISITCPGLYRFTEPEDVTMFVSAVTTSSAKIVVFGAAEKLNVSSPLSDTVTVPFVATVFPVITFL